MSDPLLDRLVEIEKDDDTELLEGGNSEALEIIEQVARRSGGLKLLVGRFSRTERVTIARALSFVLAAIADKPSRDSCNAVFDFVRDLRCNHDPSTLMNALTTIQRQAIADLPWYPISSVPDALVPFLLHCLDQSDQVQSTTLRVLERLREDELLKHLTPDQIAALRSRIEELRQLHDPLLDDGIRRLGSL